MERVFAGIPTPVVEVVDVHLHAAEELHAMLRDYGDRENRRLVAAVVGQCVVDVFAERDDAQQLAALPLLPAQALARRGYLCKSAACKRVCE